MAYQSTIPQATDQLSVSQGDLQNNFGTVSTYLNVNHVDFNGADQGKHKFITMPVQATDPSITPGFNATEIGIYNFVSPVTGQTELWSFKTSAGGEQDVPFTASTLSNSFPAQGTNGWTLLPSGILIMWGSASSVNGTVNQAVISGANIPPYNQILSVQLTPFSPGATSTFSVKLMGITNNTTFQVYVSSLGGFNWMTIGY